MSTPEADLARSDPELARGGLRPSEVVRRSAIYLERHDVESPRETAEALLMHFLGTDRAGLYSRSEGLDARTARLFGRALCRRCTGEPLPPLTREQQFMDILLRVEPGVFVPRPETELLVEAALDALTGVRAPSVVDVGTGTGAIALALKQARPDATVVATDVSDAAVELARANADRHGLDVDVAQGDLLAGLAPSLRGEVDAIVSNPPYVEAADYAALPREVLADPVGALLGGTEVHRRLAGEALEWLRPGGWLLMEIGADQGEAVRALLSEGFDSVEVLPDLAGRDRIVRGRRRPE
jgi:release factor glutamine methyltransferase